MRVRREDAGNRCLVCDEFGRNNEMWYRCTSCELWAHAECTGWESAEVTGTVNRTCGVDYSPRRDDYEGEDRIEHYPWLGVLIYPETDIEHLTTGVVLITRNIALGAADDINKFPKDSFRERTTVIFGHNCSGPRIPISEYTYHPDFKHKSFSSLAMIQLNITNLRERLYPICPPPSGMIDFTKVYTMAMSEDCKKSTIRIYKMSYVSPDQCKTFYRRNGMDIKSIWPTHTACAKAESGGQCVSRNGAVLVSKLGPRWYLLGFGVYGPGCEAPARFLDYGMYYNWVDYTLSSVGEPAITRMGPDHIILRRSLTNVQRYGVCDPEELKAELYTDETVLETQYMGNPIQDRKAVYNVTIYADVEYSCVIFRVYRNYLDDNTVPKPKIKLARWCTSPYYICYDLEMLQIEFYVEIQFRQDITFRIMAYGREVQIIDTRAMMAYSNIGRTDPVIISSNKTGQERV